MKQKEYSKSSLRLMMKYQRDEETGSLIYKHIAKREKDKINKETLIKISLEEKEHARVWRGYTNKNIKPNRVKFIWYMFLSYILGYTFVVKLMEKGEYQGIKDLGVLQEEIPEVKTIIKQEKEHEEKLIEILDEERLQYVGAMVLGLNDALVELTGTIAGLTFALANTRIVALAGIITGVAATLSMAASNYLAEKADGNPKALKASVYTGVAYLVTVALLVLPYLLFSQDMYLQALICMLAIMISIIFFFNYYISVAKSLPFKKRFFEMASISLTVAVIAFAIGMLAKNFLGIEI